MSYTAADVKKLREMTGAGMMDCKKALDEAQGNFEQAVEILRIKGAKDVGKRADRTAANGLVASEAGALLELNCETDFVAKNEQFQQLGADLVALVAREGAKDIPDFLSAKLENGKTVQDSIDAVSAVIGEKIEVGRLAALEGETVTYLHRRSPDLPPAIGVVLQYSGSDTQAARSIAMQVAAMRPKYLTRDEVPTEVVDSERRIAEETAREENKPEAAWPKIIEGRVNSFFKDVVLLEQPSVHDNKKTVADVAKEANITIEAFIRFEVGQR